MPADSKRNILHILFTCYILVIGCIMCNYSYYLKYYKVMLCAMFTSANGFKNHLLLIVILTTSSNQTRYNNFKRQDFTSKIRDYRAQMEPARATTLTLSPNETVTDLASMLKLADSLLRLARFCCCCVTELFVTSA